MADTIQLVCWTLEQECALRVTPKSQSNPLEAAESVANAKAYSEGLRRRKDGFGVYGDIYVSSHTFGTRPKEQATKDSPNYPANGFVISKEFVSLGGPEKLFKMCHDCPANIRAHELAGCVGDIMQWPASEKTEAQLQEIILRCGLEQQMRDGFAATQPLWYGLWAVSPVPSRALPVLKVLLSEMLEQDRRASDSEGFSDHRQRRKFTNFLAAIELAERRNLRLHVELLPLGHTDLGRRTIFPHCPFCKATARVERWQRKYPTALHTCQVCGTRYSPAETASVSRMDWDREELRDILGGEVFVRFAEEYLVANGETVEDAAAIVMATEADELERQKANQLSDELDRRRRKFLQAHVFSGLPFLLPPPPEYSDADEEERLSTQSTGWFDADTLAEVLQRCDKLGIEVTFMQHHSAACEKDRFQMRVKQPLDTLACWIAEGCREKFHAHYRVPDSLLKMIEPSL